MIRINIYGDSIMKGTVADEGGRYRSLLRQYLTPLAERFHLEVNNRAHFGYTIDRGMELLNKDIESGEQPEYALIEFGGNDCNFNWKEVEAFPTREHFPATPLHNFTSALTDMAQKLIKNGVKPILMNLPPIDAERYLSSIQKSGVSREPLLQWLGDAQMIYRYQELYSAAIGMVARKLNLPLLDVRSRFLEKNNYAELISPDGLHPSDQGYALIFQAFEESLSSLGGAA